MADDATALGHPGSKEWRDMSKWLVHLTQNRTSFENILSKGEIRPSGRYGAIPKYAGNGKMPSQSSCCLSEIPLDYLMRLASRHGKYGIGFKRDFIIDNQGARVWYLDRGTSVQQALFNKAKRGFTNKTLDPNDVLWKLTPFIDYVTDQHRFEWEREWRVIDGLKFTREDVAFLFAPESQHEVLKERHGEILIIDTGWSDVRIECAFRDLYTASSSDEEGSGDES